MTSQETALEEIRGRLVRLEKQNRRLKQLGIGALIVIASLVLVGQASPKKTIEANEFILRDSSGKARARLCVDDKTLGTFLRLSDENGNDDLMLASTASVGGGSIILTAGTENLVLVPSSVGFWHSGKEKGSEVVAKAQFSSGALFVTDDQGFKATLGTADLVTPSTGETHKTSAASLVLFDKDKSVIWKAP